MARTVAAQTVSEIASDNEVAIIARWACLLVGSRRGKLALDRFRGIQIDAKSAPTVPVSAIVIEIVGLGPKAQTFFMPAK